MEGREAVEEKKSVKAGFGTGGWTGWDGIDRDRREHTS